MSVPEVQQAKFEIGILFLKGFHKLNCHLVSTCYTHTFTFPPWAEPRLLGPTNLKLLKEIKISQCLLRNLMQVKANS